MPPPRLPSLRTPAARALLALELFLTGCAHAGGPPPKDATEDPEFQAALRRAEPDFPRQRDALEAGLYELFVPPESLPPPPPPVRAPEPQGGLAAADTTAGHPSAAPSLPDEAAERRAHGADDPYGGEDPSTEELLRTLPERGRRPGAPPPPRSRVSPRPPEPVHDPHAGVDVERPGESSPYGSGPYTLQLGAFGGEAAARARAAQARGLASGMPVEIAPSGGLVRVYLGRFLTEGDAEAARARLAPLGLGEAWVTWRPGS